LKINKFPHHLRNTGGFTLTEILVVLFISATLIWVANGLLKNIQTISSVVYPSGKLNQEYILFQKTLRQDLQSSLPNNIIDANETLLENGIKLNLLSVNLDIEKKEKLLQVQWKIDKDRIIRMVRPHSFDPKYYVTHQFNLSFSPLRFEIFYNQRWVENLRLDRLFIKPQAIQLRDVDEKIQLVINVY